MKPIFRLLDLLRFQRVNRHFLLSFEDNEHRTSYKRYFLSTLETKDYNEMINIQNFDQLAKNNLIAYGNIQKTENGQEDDYKTGCLLNYVWFKKYYKMTAIYLSKQQVLDADAKAIHDINFTKIWIKIEKCFSLTKKRNKLFWIFHKES